MKRVLSAVITLIMFAAAGPAAEVKFVTEYRYPTEYDVTPIMATGANGVSTVVGGIVTPRNFETREVGVRMNVEATVGWLGALGGAMAGNGRQRINGNTALMLAATSGETRRVRALLGRGADVNAANRFGSTALMGASAGGFSDIVALLLAKKATVDAASGRGSTALMFAAKNGHLPVVKQLLAAGADINAADARGMTPLMYAIEGHWSGMVRYLAQNGADLNVTAAGGKTPLMVASAQRDEAIVVLLTRLGAEQ